MRAASPSLYISTRMTSDRVMMKVLSVLKSRTSTAGLLGLSIVERSSTGVETSTNGKAGCIIASTGFVTITTSDSAGGQAVTIVLDSLQIAPGAPIPPDAVKSAAGATWHGFRPANGRMKNLKLDGENPVAGTVAGILQEIFPPLKAGAREGSSWTDTTDTDTGNSGVMVRTVTNFLTSGDTYNGAKVLKLAGASSSAISGTQESPQGSMSFEGTGSGTTTWLVGSDGYSLGSTYSSKQSLSITAAIAPEPLPVEITTEGTVTLLK